MPMQNLFVAKLPRNLTDSDLLAIFREYKPLSAKVMLDAASGKSKGFGFVLFNSEEEGQNAYNALNRKSTRSCGHNFTLVIYPSNHDGKAASESSNALYIRNIPMTISQECVEQFLRSFGTLTYCAMREDHYGSPVWVVYAEYNTIEEARHALCKLHGNHSYFHGSAPILAKFEDSEAAKRQRRQRREVAVNVESVENKVKVAENADANANANAGDTNTSRKTCDSIRCEADVVQCEDDKNGKDDICSNVINEGGNEKKIDSGIITVNTMSANNDKHIGVRENDRNVLNHKVSRTVSAERPLYSSSTTFTKAAINATESNNSQFAQTPSLLLSRNPQRHAEKEYVASHRSHNNHANPFHPSYRSTASTHASFDEKSKILSDMSSTTSTGQICKNSVDYTGHSIISKSHTDKPFSVQGEFSDKSTFDGNHDSLVTGLSASMSCSSAQTGQMLQPSQFPPPYRHGVGLLEASTQSMHNNRPTLAQECDFMSKSMSHSLNVSSYNDLSQSYMVNNVHRLNNSTSVIPSSLPQLIQPSHLMTSCHGSTDEISATTKVDEGERNYCYTLNDNGEPILLGMTTSSSPVTPASQLASTRAQSCPYHLLQQEQCDTAINTNEISGSNTLLTQVIPTAQSMTYLNPITIANNNNNNNNINNGTNVDYNRSNNININNNSTEPIFSNGANANNVLCLSGQPIQLSQPLNAPNTVKNLSLLAPQPQTTLMLVDGTQQYVVSSDAVNISSLSSPAVSSPYSANSPMFLTSINTPQPEQQQQQEQQQFATQLFGICYGKSVPVLPQVLPVGSTQELRPQLAASLDISPKINEANEFIRHDSAQLSIPEILFMPVAQSLQK